MANITGTAGNDTRTGTSGADTITGLGGNDTLNGGGGVDRVDGGTGDDILNGGAGVDLLIGGAGNDTYTIDNAAEINKNTADAGIDTVQSSVTYTLGAQQENLTLTGSAALNGTGNATNNILLGNGGINQLNGMVGNDTLTGNNGNDTLTGAAGNDTLNGGAGNDTLVGGAGNDRLLGGAGNDNLTFDALDTRGVDGGAGTDTLKAVSGSTNLVTLNGESTRFANFEIIDLGAAGTQSVVLNLDTVLGLSTSTDTLRVDGTSADTVVAGSGWVFYDVVQDGGQTYQLFFQSTAVLEIDADVDSGLDFSFQLSTLNGMNGFQINGEAAYDNSGRIVSAAGDVNGDGFDDFLIGAYNRDTNGTTAGATYVVFGAAGFSSAFNLSALNGTNGFEINGESEYDRSAASVSGAGDVNGDGFDDLLIGATGVDIGGSYSGSTYVVFGSGAAFASRLDLSSLNGTNGFRLDGESATDHSGASVSGAGDVNGDGYDDLLVGASDRNTTDADAGATYLVFGRGNGFASSIDLSVLNGTDGFEIDGEGAFVSGGDYSGFSVSSAGDVNSDGFDDILIGAWGRDVNGSLAGASYVVFGSDLAFASSFELESLDGNNGFEINGETSAGAGGDYAGISVSGGGDVNGDGYDDLLIGASGRDVNNDRAGATYVVFGGPSFNANLDLAALNGSNGFEINGEETVTTGGDYSGQSVSDAGDVNGDGYDDLLIGAFARDVNGTQSGATYVVFGGTGFPANLDLSDLNGVNGFEIDGETAYDASGRAVSAAGDVNGDGFDDLLIGANGGDTNFDNAGSSYILYGRDFGDEITTAREGTTGNDTITGTAVAEILVGGLGNDTLNGGGGADFLNGAAGNDVLNGDAGADRLTGRNGNDTLDGGAAADRLDGGEGDDSLDGGLGNDVLKGGADNDIFLFNDTLGAANVDTMMDFGGMDSGELDSIHLENGIFTALSSTGELNPANFVGNGTGVAMDPNDFIVYNTATGELFYDADGSGAGSAVKFAVLATDPDHLQAEDFIVI